MSKQQELISFIENLTEEQAQKLVERLPLLQELVALPDWEARVTTGFIKELSNRAGEGA